MWDFSFFNYYAFIILDLEVGKVLGDSDRNLFRFDIIFKDSAEENITVLYLIAEQQILRVWEWN